MKRQICFAISLFLAISLVSASGFEIKKNSSYVEPNYLEGEIVSGLLNMSFDEQENVYFNNSLTEDGTKMLDLLKAMNFTRGRDYFCDPVNCDSYYNASNGANEKEITLGEDKKLYGFKIKETKEMIKEINSLEFRIDVWADQDCVNQLAIDLFNDGIIDYYNKQPYVGAGAEGCWWFFNSGETANRGCFKEEDVSRELPIGEELYCEYMKDIPPSASYEIGGNINVSGGGVLTFEMYPAEGGDEILWRGETVPPVGQNNKAYVIANYSSYEKFNALVCVYAQGEYADGRFYIKTNEEEDDKCGFVFEPGNGVSEDDFDIDYDLYINPRGYDSLQTVAFNNSFYEEFTGRRLKDDLKDYINKTYGMNCSGDDGCVIPLGVWGRENPGQGITGAKLAYKFGKGTSNTVTEIYSVREKPAKISSKWLGIDIDKLDIDVPNKNGKYSFKLYLGGKEIISKEINVDVGFLFTLTPRFAYIGRETAFVAKSDSGVTSSIWDFGDSSGATTVSGYTAKHKYNAPGEYTVKVTLIKPSSGAPKNSTKRFKVVVGEAKESAELTLKDYEARLANLETNVSVYPSWVKTSLTSALGIDTKKTQIQTKRTELSNLGDSSADEEYVKIIEDLLGIDLPYSIFSSAGSGLLPADVGYAAADMNKLIEISGDENVTDLEDLKARAFAWMAEHYEISESFETVSAVRDSQNTELLKIYKIKLNQKEEPNVDSAYLVIGHPKNNLIFSSQANDFLETTNTGGTYIDLVETPITEIDFLVVGQDAPLLMDLGIYVSPVPKDLGIDNREIRKCWLENCDPQGNFLWGRFLFGMLGIIFLFLVVYLLLQGWYKKNYEKHLFPNANDLYNLLNFIYNSRRNSLKDSDIKGSLRNRNWTGEQVAYAFNKLEGKRTGMWEIPILKFAENRKVRKELEKQQGGRPIDTRFIKRPNL